MKPKLAVYSHIVPWPTTAKDLEGPTRKTYAGPLLVGEDLTVIDVGETVMAKGRPGTDAGASVRDPGIVAK